MASLEINKAFCSIPGAIHLKLTPIKIQNSAHWTGLLHINFGCTLSEFKSALFVEQAVMHRPDSRCFWHLLIKMCGCYFSFYLMDVPPILARKANWTEWVLSQQCNYLHCRWWWSGGVLMRKRAWDREEEETQRSDLSSILIPSVILSSTRFKKKKSHLQKEKKEREGKKKKSLLQPAAINWLQSSGPSLREEKHCGLGGQCAARELRELGQPPEGW